jgi:hypothetical protein
MRAIHTYPVGAETSYSDGNGADFGFWDYGGGAGDGRSYGGDGFGDGFAFGDTDGDGYGDLNCDNRAEGPEIYESGEFVT